MKLPLMKAGWLPTGQQVIILAIKLPSLKEVSSCLELAILGCFIKNKFFLVLLGIAAVLTPSGYNNSVDKKNKNNIP